MKRILLLTVFVLALLTGCDAPVKPQPTGQTASPSSAPSETADTTPVYDVYLPTLPEGVSDGDLTLVALPNRQQYVYAAQTRLVLEVMEPGTDETLAERESVQTGSLEIAAYVFAEGDIDYGDLPAAVRQGMAHPNSGDQVLEWEADGRFYRLFGAYALETLLAVAADVA